MVKVARAFPDAEIVATLSRQLAWRHFIELAEVSDPTKRFFYQQMSILYHWSVRQLLGQEDKMVYERSLIAAKPEDEQEKVLTIGIFEKAKSVVMDAMEKAIGGRISTILPKCIPKFRKFYPSLR